MPTFSSDIDSTISGVFVLCKRRAIIFRMVLVPHYVYGLGMDSCTILKVVAAYLHIMNFRLLNCDSEWDKDIV